jgi:hypothetical protein
MRSQLVVWRQRTNRVDALEADAYELGVAGRMTGVGRDKGPD